MAFGRVIGNAVVAAIAIIGLIIGGVAIAIPGVAVAAVFWVIDRFDAGQAAVQAAPATDEQRSSGATGLIV